MKRLQNPEQSIGPNNEVLTQDEISLAVQMERRWLQNNAVSAVTGGPVEDQEGVPLPADLHQGTPPVADQPPEE